jgi:hypothetical protein
MTVNYDRDTLMAQAANFTVKGDFKCRRQKIGNRTKKRKIAPKNAKSLV